MRLKARLLNIRAGGRRIAIIDNETASSLGLHSSDRARIRYKNKNAMVIVNVAGDFPPSHVGLYEEVSEKLGIADEEIVDLCVAEIPESLRYVQAKIRGERLRDNEINLIVRDVVERHLSDVELAAFVTALHTHHLSMDEVEALSKAMVK
ncbi:MAG: thymidine phosphorylase, partial [Chloroflexota bacterium]